MPIIEQLTKLNDKLNQLAIKLPKALITPARLMGIGIVLLTFTFAVTIDFFREHMFTLLVIAFCLIVIAEHLTDYWTKTSKDYVEYPVQEAFIFRIVIRL